MTTAKSWIRQHLGGRIFGISEVTSQDSVYKTENTSVGIRWPRGILYPQKLVLTSPASGGRSVGIVRSRTEATVIYLIISGYSWM
jgi:hypothetical protein